MRRGGEFPPPHGMDETPPILEPAPEPIRPPRKPPPPGTSLAARLLNIFAVPGQVFDEVKASPPRLSNWLGPALLVLAVGWFAAWLVYSREPIQRQLREMADQAIQKQVEKGQMTQKDAERSREFSRLGARVLPFVTPVFLALIAPLGWGLILWGIGGRILGSPFPLAKAVEVAGLANTICVLEIAVKTLLIIGVGNLLASSNPAALLKDFDPKNPGHSLLLVANLMAFWILVVRAIGLARLTGVPFPRAATWVFGAWLLMASLLLCLGLGAQAALGG